MQIATTTTKILLKIIVYIRLDFKIHQIVIQVFRMYFKLIKKVKHINIHYNKDVIQSIIN